MKVLNHEVTLKGQNANKEFTVLVCDGKECKGSELPAEVRQWFKEQPRVSVRSNGSPKIKFDGVEAQLGYWACNEEELDTYKASRSGTSSSGTRVKNVDPEVRSSLLTLLGTLKGESKKELQGIIDKYFPDPEEAKKQAKIAALQAQLAELLGK